MLSSRRDHLFNLAPVPKVERQDKSGAALLLNFFGQRFEQRPATGDKHKPRTLAGQSDSRRASDAAGSAGDNDYFIRDDSGTHGLDYIE